MVLHPPPREVERSDWLEAYYYSGLGQLGRLVSPGYYVERELGGPAALDTNAFGKVPDSTWFRNRIGRVPMSPEEVRVGPNRSAGPAPGTLTIVKAKLQGVTPGFFVRDGAGVRWLVKFDAPAYPEMNSSAEVISTKLLYALGYYVPENHIARFHLSDLEISEKATMLDRYNRKRPFSRAHLHELVALLNPEADGRIRALFSRFLPGRPVGPFPAVGVRLDDPNDHIPHERRRSLRGLRAFYAWLNNTDAKVTNTLDTFLVQDEASGRGYLRHHLIDFGSSLGAAGHGLKALAEGYDYLLDWERIGRRYLALGIYYPYWVTVKRTRYLGVGTFESRVFDPKKWRSLYPNNVLEAADAQDWLWAGAILAHVQRSHIEAAVAAGELSEPGASQWVSQVLWERRAKVLRHAFAGQAPIDDPKVATPLRLCWTDLVTLGFREPADSASYPWALRHEPAGEEVKGVARRPCAELADPLAELKQRVGESGWYRYPFATLYVGRKAWASSDELVRVAIDLRLVGDELLVIGLRRECGSRCR